MGKLIGIDEEAQEKICAGVSKLAKAVRVTLGPGGRNVIMSKSFGPPTVTKDGVTIAREIELSDKFEDMGAKMVKEVASKTSDVVGDGTTTATILAEAIYKEGLRAIISGVNPLEMKRGMDAAVEAVVERLKGMSIECRHKRSIAQVATVAANGDTEIGDILADAMEKVGKDGVITVEEGKSLKTDYTVVEGMQFDRGFLSPYFVTDPQTTEAVLEDCYVLMHEKKISNIKDLIPILEKVVQAGMPLLIIAEDVEGEALASLVIHRLRGILRCVAVKAPGYGDRRKAMLQDIAIMLGGTVISADPDSDLHGLDLADLGWVAKVVVDKDTTTLLEGRGQRADIEVRIDQIRQERERSSSEYDRQRLDERIARLSGGIARVNVGAATESEMREKKARVEDALQAVRAAVTEGILPGGGVALLRASKAVQPGSLSDDAITGFNIILRACQVPVTQIANNAGVDGRGICEKVGELSGNQGYNAATGMFEDLVKTGIVDPTKVTRSALQNAASVATMLLTSDALVMELEDWSNEPNDQPMDSLPPRPRPALHESVFHEPALHEQSAGGGVKPHLQDALVSRLFGEVIDFGAHNAICWLDVAPGSRVKVEVPLEKLTGISLAPGRRFAIHDDPANQECQFKPLQRDSSLDARFEEMSRRFREWHASGSLPRDFPDE
jgi:chaperonin GroEL